MNNEEKLSLAHEFCKIWENALQNIPDDNFDERLIDLSDKVWNNIPYMSKLDVFIQDIFRSLNLPKLIDYAMPEVYEACQKLIDDDNTNKNKNNHNN